MKIIMLMGLPENNNLELAHFLQVKHSNSYIINRSDIKHKYKNLPVNSLVIDFILIRNIKQFLKN